MTKRLLLPSLVALLVGLLGCPSREPKVVTDLPEPLIHTKDHPKPSQHQPQPPKVSKTPYGPPGWMPPSGISPRWKVIVIHHSATPTGDAGHFDAAHRAKGWDELGYHFVIGNGTDTADGCIEVGSRWAKQKHGAHCKVPGNYYNDHGIGICLVGDFDKAQPSARQIAALGRLVAYLCRNCNIPLSQVTTHRNATGKTACPGRCFSLTQVKHAVAESDPQLASSR